MIPASVISRMATLGLTEDQAAAVAEMLSAVEAATQEKAGSAIEARRKNDRERKERQRVKSRDLTGCHVTSRDGTGQDVTERDAPPKVSPKDNKSNPLPNPPSSSLRSDETARKRRDEADLLIEFEGEFWRSWRNKVGKPDAIKAFVRVRRAGVALATILDGVRAYTLDQETSGRPWLNPSTFLNQRRWEDERAPTPTTRAGPAPNAPRRSSIDLAAERLLAESLGLETPRRNQPDPFDGPTLDLGVSDCANRA